MRRLTGIRAALAAASVAGALAVVPASAQAITTPPNPVTTGQTNVFLAVPPGPSPLVTVSLGF
jgi:hypothetical protein